MRFSVICAYNNPEMFEACVQKSLKNQHYSDYEILGVNTLQTAYSSAALALNEGAKKAKGEFLVFLHQDIVIEDPDFLTMLSQMLNEKEVYVAGVAGIVKAKGFLRGRIITNIVHGVNRVRPGQRVKGGSMVECETVDECFFVIPNALFRKRNFKEYVPSWHLYCVEYCLWAKTQKEDSVKLLPLELWHKSKGASLNESYYATLDEIIRTYNSPVYTTMGIWPRNVLLRRIKKYRQLLSRNRILDS